MAKSNAKEKQEAASPADAAPEGFLSHYATLQDTARALREQTEPDLDALIPLVDRALAAYKGCKSRIEAVQSLLDQRLATVEELEEASAATAPLGEDDLGA